MEILKVSQSRLQPAYYFRALDLTSYVEQLIRSVYNNAGLDPKETGYVEAHGTGTKVGDPIEARALYNVFGEGRTVRNPLFIGSVKSNIGHLEAASG